MNGQGPDEGPDAAVWKRRAAHLLALSDTSLSGANVHGAWSTLPHLLLVGVARSKQWCCSVEATPNVQHPHHFRGEAGHATMGASESKLAFKEDIFRLAGDDDIPLENEWWLRVCYPLWFWPRRCWAPCRRPDISNPHPLL